MIKVSYINNNGGGFGSTIPVDEGTTLADFLKHQMPGFVSTNYRIRHNGDIVAQFDSVLEDGDQVLVTPTKVEGA